MLATLPLAIRIPLVSLAIVTNTLVHALPLLGLALVKAVVPHRGARGGLSRVLARLAESWIAFNSIMIDVFTHTVVDLEGVEQLDPQRSYLVLVNHQSWVDIPVLQKAFNRRIPLLRFFLKRQLFWVPVLGLVWWALDFPFMRRHGREAIAADPSLARRDIEATRRACARLRGIPVSIVNFAEGTRATPEKLAGEEQRDYRWLLRPKAGGTAFVLAAMADSLDSILDVTVIYPEGRATLWDFVSGRLPSARVLVRRLPLPGELLEGDYENDPVFRARFRSWLNALWREKDARIEAALKR